MPVTILPASEMDFDTLVKTFNTAYQDYMVPLQLNTFQMRQTIMQNDINLSMSRVALVDGSIIGLGFLAERGPRGWIGGMGIVPSHRGLGIGRQIMASLLETAWAQGLTSVQLEVIEGNDPAHQLYLRMGFQTTRRLLIVQCMEAPKNQHDIRCEEVSSEDALAYYEPFHAVANPWQRQLETLRTATDLSGWLALGDGIPLAYIVGRITPKMIQIMDAAFAPGEAGALQALIASIHQQKADVPASMVNLGEDDPAWPALAELGYYETLAQLEMVVRPV